jgi:PAS domain S-box-containing protein
MVETFKELFDFSRDVLWLMAPDGSITYVSPAIYLLRGITPEEAKYQKLEETLVPESAHRSVSYFVYMLSEIAAGRKPEPFQGPMDYFHANGSIVKTDVYAVPAFDELGNFSFLAGVSRDISARVLAEEKKKTEMKLREIEFRKMLNSVLEHEVRNALAVINLAFDARLMEATTAGRIRKSIDDLLQVVEQVGLFSRSSDLEKRMKASAVPVWTVLQEVQRKLGLSDSMVCEGDQGLLVWAEHSLMQQLFEQIVVNAGKYAEPGTKISVTCGGKSEENERMATIRFANSHIAPQDIAMERLFDPFYRGAHVSGKSGSGLGLTIAKHLTEMLNGSIALEYIDATFFVTLSLPSAME